MIWNILVSTINKIEGTMHHLLLHLTLDWILYNFWDYFSYNIVILSKQVNKERRYSLIQRHVVFEVSS